MEEYLRVQKETTLLMEEINRALCNKDLIVRNAAEKMKTITAKNELDKAREKYFQVLIEDISARKVDPKLPNAVMEMKAIPPSLMIATTVVGFSLASILGASPIVAAGCGLSAGYKSRRGGVS